MTAQLIDKAVLKSVLEEMFYEGNPALQKILEELLIRVLSAQQRTDKSMPLDMATIRQRYGLKKEMFVALQEVFNDAPPASELVKHLRK